MVKVDNGQLLEYIRNRNREVTLINILHFCKTTPTTSFHYEVDLKWHVIPCHTNERDSQFYENELFRSQYMT